MHSWYCTVLWMKASTKCYEWSMSVLHVTENQVRLLSVILHFTVCVLLSNLFILQCYNNDTSLWECGDISCVYNGFKIALVYTSWLNVGSLNHTLQCFTTVIIVLLRVQSNFMYDMIQMVKLYFKFVDCLLFEKCKLNVQPPLLYNFCYKAFMFDNQ